MKYILLSFLFLFLTLNLNAQVPEKMSFQSVIRNSSGTLISNQAIGLKICILYSPSDTSIFEETHLPFTSQNGLISIEIGNGTPLKSNLSNIDWSSGTYYIKTMIDPDGGNNYSLFGTTQLLTVPYAFYAEKSGSQSIIRNHGLIVTDFGAIGDGATDDTQAFQNALDSATISKTKIYIPAGNYKISSSLVVPGGVSLIGDGLGDNPLQTPSKGSIISYYGTGFALIINEHTSSIRDLIVLDKSNSVSEGGITIFADGRLCESHQLTNVLISGFTGGDGLKLESKNSGGIAYCSFYDVRVRNAKVGIRITQDATSFTNSNNFYHGAISGGGFDYGLLIENGNNNTFYGLVIEPPTSTNGHLVVKKGEVQCVNIRIEGNSQPTTSKLISFESGTMNSNITGTYGGGLTLDNGNNNIFLHSSKSLNYQNSSFNQFNNAAFIGNSETSLPEWIITGTGVTYTIQNPEFTNEHNVLKITVPAGITATLKSTMLSTVNSATFYDQISFGFNVKTTAPGLVLTTSNAPAGVASSIPYSGSNEWEFIGMNALVDRNVSLDSKLVINNTTGAPLIVYVTAPTFVYGNQTPTLDPKPLSSNGGNLNGMLNQNLVTIETPADNYLILPKTANYFEITNSTLITRINHLTANRISKGTVITLLFNVPGTSVTNNAYINLKASFTSVLQASLTLMSNGDGTWREISRNN
jgi:hypothetical protein